MSIRRVFESWKEPPNKHILWLNTDNGVTYKYDFEKGKWVPLYDKAMENGSNLALILKEIIRRIEILESYHVHKRSFNKSFNKSFGK